MSDIDEMCVITHPIGSATENHVQTLLDIISAVTTVSLIVVAASEDSQIRKNYDTTQISEKSTGGSVPVAATRFLINQLRMARVVYSRPEPTVLFFGVTSYLIPILAAKLAGKTVVLQPRGDVPLTLRLQWEQRMPDRLARLLASSVGILEAIGYRTADAIITYTPSMADELGLNRYEEKLYPHGARYVDIHQFYPHRSFEERERVIGFLGRLDKEKGIQTLAEVAGQLPDDISFRFIGDGAFREWLETELSEEIAAGRVEVTGWVGHEDVPAELSELRLLVMPSAPTEGLPTTILEAMACGTPVYATPVSGVPDVVREGQTGFVMDDTESAAVSAAIVEILADDSLTEISDNARRLIETEYSFHSAVQRWEKMLREISELDSCGS